MVGVVVGRAHDVQRVAVVVLRHLQNDEVEPHLLRGEYFLVERRENVPHVRVVNHAVVAFNEPQEILVGVDGVGHGGHCGGRVAPRVCLHFLHVFGVLVHGDKHLFFLFGRGPKHVHQRAVLIREEGIQRDAVQDNLFHFRDGFRVRVLSQRCHARNERLPLAELRRFFVAPPGIRVPLLHAAAQQALLPFLQGFVRVAHLARAVVVV